MQLYSVAVSPLQQLSAPFLLDSYCSSTVILEDLESSYSPRAYFNIFFEPQRPPKLFLEIVSYKRYLHISDLPHLLLFAHRLLRGIGAHRQLLQPFAIFTCGVHRDSSLSFNSAVFKQPRWSVQAAVHRARATPNLATAARHARGDTFDAMRLSHNGMFLVLAFRYHQQAHAERFHLAGIVQSTTAVVTTRTRLLPKVAVLQRRAVVLTSSCHQRSRWK